MLLWFIVAATFWTQPVRAQITHQVAGTTNTQAVLVYDAPSAAACSVAASQSSGYSPLANDVNPALFPGSNMDSREPALLDGQRRVFVIGKRRSDKAGNGKLQSRALETNSSYHYRITCGAEQAEGTFTTQNPPMGNTAPELPPFHADGFGNYGWPAIDWSDRNKTYIDPLTGVLTKLATFPGDLGNRIGFPFGTDMYLAYSTNWTNPQNAPSGTTSSLARYSGPGNEALFVGMDPTTANPGFRPPGGFNNLVQVDDLGIRVYGFGTDASSANRTIRICLTADSGQTCATDWIEVALPAGSASEVGVFPTVFPKPMFGGWGKPVVKHDLPTTGKVKVNGSIVDLTKSYLGGDPDAFGFFNPNLAPSTKIWIAGTSSSCPQNLCTVANLISGTRLEIEENLSITTDTDYRAANFGIRVWKTTAAGAVSASFRLETAWSFPTTMPVTGADERCSRNMVTVNTNAGGSPGPAQKGYLCVVPTAVSSQILVFISTDTGEVRPLGAFRNPGTIPGANPADQPFPPEPVTATSFDPTINNALYTSLRTGPTGATRSIFRVTYSGDYRAWSPNYPPGSGGEQPALPSDNLVWQNITKPSEGKDVQAQVNVIPGYDVAKFGDLKDTPGRGVSGKFMIFTRNTGAQDSPCWIFFFDVTTGGLVRGFNSWDGQVHESLRWAGCHAADAAGPPNYFYLAPNVLRQQAPWSLLGGPFESTLVSLRRGGMWNSNTALPPSADGTYEAACPDDLSQKWKDAGATANNCVTLRIQGEPCSAYASETERTQFPCPYDSTRSLLQPMIEGDVVFDPTAALAADSERMRIVKKTALAGGQIELVLQRFAYSPRCGPLPAQRTHPNGWKLVMGVPVICESGVSYITPVNGVLLNEDSALSQSHFDLAAGLNDGEFATVTAGYVSRRSAGVDVVGQPADYAQNAFPRFAGAAGANIGGVLQSYPSLRQWAAPSEERRWATDFRHYNGSYGGGGEVTFSPIGTTTSTLVAGTTRIYKTSVVGTVSYKQTGLLSWAGRYLLREKSSPDQGDTLTDADTWRFCYAFRDGECRNGSVAGEVFVNVPKATITGYCQTAQLARNIPCVISPPAMGAWAVQLDIARNDPNGRGIRRLTMGFSGPGRQFHFANVRPTPDARWAILPGHWLDGTRYEVIAIKLPPYRDESTVNRGTFLPVEVSLGAVENATKAVVEFGYEENGPPETMRCTPRAETCVAQTASVSEANPFLFAGESLTPAPCASGCKIVVPAMAGRVLFYRTRYLDASGKTVFAGKIEAQPVF